MAPRQVLILSFAPTWWIIIVLSAQLVQPCKSAINDADDMYNSSTGTNFTPLHPSVLMGRLVGLSKPFLGLEETARVFSACLFPIGVSVSVYLCYPPPPSQTAGQPTRVDSSLLYQRTSASSLENEWIGIFNISSGCALLPFSVMSVLTIRVQRMLFQFRVNQGENENLTGLYYLYTDPTFFVLWSAFCPHYAHTHKHTR